MGSGPGGMRVDVSTLNKDVRSIEHPIPTVSTLQRQKHDNRVWTAVLKLLSP